MSKRRIVYGGQVPRALDILENARNWLVATGRGFMDTFRSNVDPALNTYPILVAGFTPTYPGGTQLTLAAGRIYSYQAVDATAYGEDPIDARQVYQQGEAEIQTLTFGAAPGVGLTRIDIVQVRYLQQDTDPAVLLYYNSANPDEPLSGPGGNNVPDNQNRSELAVVQVKAGTASGSPVAPTPDAGFSLLFTVTIPNGLTNIASGNVAPNTSLFLAGLLSQHHLGLPGTAPKIDLTSEVQNDLPGTQVADSGGTTAQAYMNLRRDYRGEYADAATRDAALTVPAEGYWVVLIDSDGMGTPGFSIYHSGAWVVFGGGGGGGGAGNVIIHPPITFVGGETTATVPVPYDTSQRQLLLTLGHLALIQGPDWTATNATTVTLTKAALAGEILQIVQFFVVGGSSVYQTVDEIPSGSVTSTDGTNGNGTFTTVNAPLTLPRPEVFFDGRLIPISWYTITGNTITFGAGFKPQTDGTYTETVTINYSWH